MAASGTTNRMRQAASPRPATPSSITQRPPPSAALAVSSETAKARDPEGISSTAMMLITRISAVAKARATVWLTPSHTRLGASAPVAVTTHPARAETSSTQRRPRRSARATTARASSAPTRTTASIVPIWPSVLANSSLKNVLVCDSSVPR